MCHNNSRMGELQVEKHVKYILAVEKVLILFKIYFLFLSAFILKFLLKQVKVKWKWEQLIHEFEVDFNMGVSKDK